MYKIKAWIFRICCEVQGVWRWYKETIPLLRHFSVNLQSLSVIPIHYDWKYPESSTVKISLGYIDQGVFVTFWIPINSSDGSSMKSLHGYFIPRETEIYIEVAEACECSVHLHYKSVNPSIFFCWKI